MPQTEHGPEDLELLLKINPDLIHKYLLLQQQFGMALRNATAEQVDAIEAEFECKIQSLVGWVSCPDCRQ